MSAPRDLLRMINGYQVTQAIHVAAVLGISDVLAGGPRTLAEIADATGSHPDSLGRLLRALCVCKVYAVDDDGRYVNADLGDALRTDAAGSPAGWARFVGRPNYWHAWSALLHSVRTGENAYASVHGESVWSYRQQHPDEQVAFDNAMTSLTFGGGRAVAEAYDFGRFSTVVDVGGGRGALLAEILAAYPGLRGVLVDQPHVVAHAELPAAVAARCQIEAGDFFVAVPYGEVYLLKAIIHDWPDAESVRILSNVRAAMPADGVVVLIEHLLDEGPDPVRAAFSDLNMLVAPGGRERTRAEYAALFERAGLVLEQVVPTARDQFLVTAVRSPRRESPGTALSS